MVKNKKQVLSTFAKPLVSNNNAGQEMLRLVDSVQGRFEGRFFRYRERRKK